MSSSRRRVKRTVVSAKRAVSQSHPFPTKWRALAVTLSLAATLLLLWKFAPAFAKPAQAQQLVSSLVASPASSLPEPAIPPQTLLKQTGAMQHVDINGTWKRADQLKKGDVVVMPDGRQLVVKNLDNKTQTAVKKNLEFVASAPSVPSQHEETTLELDLSHGGDAFDETLVVPASQTVISLDGRNLPARELKSNDRILMSGARIALVKKAETKMYTPPPPQKPDKNGNVFSRVIGTTKRMTNRVLYLHTSEEVIGTTPEHPFSVDGKGWVQAGRLQPGDRVKTEDGKLITVESLEVKAERKMVYNLKIEGTEDYFVGKNKLLVHNGGDCVPDLAAGKYLAKDAPFQITPGTRTLEGYHVNDFNGRVEPWCAHYDDYGRMIGRTDYNAGNISHGIPDTHFHQYRYNNGIPHEFVKHAPGEFVP